MSSPPPSADLGTFLERAALPPGWRVVYEPVVASTMDLGREAARRGWPDRSVFVCDYQTAGRGREARRWEAPPGRALLLTLLVRWPEPPFVATMLAAVALAEAIARLVQVEPSIKWPNDLLVGDAKLAGVLGESHSGPPAPYALVGCGLNVNQDAAELGDLGRAATSLLLEAGRPVHRGELLVLFLESCQAWLDRPRGGLAAELRAAWQARLWGRGRPVRLRDLGRELTATIEAVDGDGALLVRETQGQLRRIVSGEIVLE